MKAGKQLCVPPGQTDSVGGVAQAGPAPIGVLGEAAAVGAADHHHEVLPRGDQRPRLGVHVGGAQQRRRLERLAASRHGAAAGDVRHEPRPVVECPGQGPAPHPGDGALEFKRVPSRRVWCRQPPLVV